MREPNVAHIKSTNFLRLKLDLDNKYQISCFHNNLFEEINVFNDSK